MRSRYTAYALHRHDHVFRTWHPRTRPDEVATDLSLSWEGLTVLEVADGGAADDRERSSSAPAGRLGANAARSTS